MSRLQENILKVGNIGVQEDGGITRLGFSSEYFKGIEETKKIMEDAGLEVHIDKVGNISGYLEGSDPNAKTILVGSHLDTVPDGGIFDGNMGVMAAIECIYRMKESGIKPKHSIKVIGFNSEESSPLGGTFGSRAMMGLVDLKQDGFHDILASYGLTEDDVLSAQVNTDNDMCYLEMHIEQGDRLFNEKLEIGIVTGIVGITRYRIIANGQSNHAGTTMMNNRKDALVAMAKLITFIDKRAKEYGDGFVATVGTISVTPSSANVIPGTSEICLELRHMDSSVYLRFINEVREYAATIKEVTFEINRMIDKGSQACDQELIDNFDLVCRRDNVSYIKMPSGAGHDSNPVAHKLPIGMIFIPSKDGISHSRYEWSEWNDIETGTRILYDAIQELDKK